MKVEKLRKTCGYILYIKSIIALVVTIILIFGGITMAIMGKHMVDNQDKVIKLVLKVP